MLEPNKLSYQNLYTSVQKFVHSHPHEPLILLTFFFFLLTLIYIGFFARYFLLFFKVKIR
ncbi:hypothetical protein BC03BB108_F0006 (plasmid) [Bacillus cereus 03BB108]|nr:hypothetical protein BC03BB108_F0006 [Bacillus cereus 03BB108]